MLAEVSRWLLNACPALILLISATFLCLKAKKKNDKSESKSILRDMSGHSNEAVEQKKKPPLACVDSTSTFQSKILPPALSPAPLLSPNGRQKKITSQERPAQTAAVPVKNVDHYSDEKVWSDSDNTFLSRSESYERIDNLVVAEDEELGRVKLIAKKDHEYLREIRRKARRLAEQKQKDEILKAPALLAAEEDMSFDDTLKGVESLRPEAGRIFMTERSRKPNLQKLKPDESDRKALQACATSHSNHPRTDIQKYMDKHRDQYPSKQNA
ncbi:unnamed protein product [Caenorhabditis auriculariae]|uniref:Uncharacterized protein n=1 Tax=Caenorhabditis auriculariae TaxID=2777116 RepID=A0A8S1H2H7_9PELO|nr:unnamed protein product [Caenorhabditis auriculariae]